MAINHVVIEGNLASKPGMTDGETCEFLIYHQSAAGRFFGVFHVEAWSGAVEPALFRAAEGDPVIVSGALVQGRVLEGSESREVVKVRALRVVRVRNDRPQPPRGYEDRFLEEDIPF